MDPLTWLVVLALGGVLGMVGQGARAIVGLKKQADQAAANGQKLSECFSGATLGVSLLIGFVAGVVGVVGLVAAGKIGASPVGGETMVTLLGIGYAGADFIEGFMQRAVPSSGIPSDSAHSTTQPVNDKPAQVDQTPAHSNV